MSMSDWELPMGADRCILGTTHVPAGDARGVVVHVHGYTGYKDYGMHPWVACRMCESGFIVHRINLSDSGCGHGHGLFDDEKFRRGTWNRSVEDVLHVLAAIGRGQLAGQGCGAVLMGHSRGGATSLLTMGRHAKDEAVSSVCGVISLAAPASLQRLLPGAVAQLQQGIPFELTSQRTGQTLHVNPCWIQEQMAEPEKHDLSQQLAQACVPCVLIHGSEDPTVPPSDAVRLAQAAPMRCQVHLIEGGNHPFNTPNPFPCDAAPSQELATCMTHVIQALDSWF